MKGMTELECQLMQMFMVGIPGTDVSPETRSFLQDHQPGGILYFAHNYETPVLLGKLSLDLQKIAKKTNKSLPLILAVDQEGGQVQRLKRPFTQLPQPMDLGDKNFPPLTFSITQMLAKELMAVGINLDFWPLCDIHTQPKNPVIGRRAFSTQEEVVSRMASAVIRGFITSGMISCMKHFPGHGDTTVDSHLDLPEVHTPWADLLKREIKPFQRAMISGVDMCMIAHILNPSIDTKYPASLSKQTIQSHLREELQFEGVVICDDMQMEAIKLEPEEAITLAINGGNDILIYRDMHQGQKAMEIAVRLLQEGRIKKDRVLESYTRIAKLKKDKLKNFPSVKLNAIPKIVGCEEHTAVMDQLKE